MRLNIAGHDVQLVAWPPRGRRSSTSLPDADALEPRLREVANQSGPDALTTLLTEAQGPSSDATRLPSSDPVDQVIDALRTGRVVVAPGHWRFRPKHLPTVTSPPPTADNPPARRERATKAWIAFKIVDERTGHPVSSVRIRVTLPDGAEDYHTTSASGLIRLDDLTPGSCDLTCDLTGATLHDTYEFKGQAAPEPDKDAWPSARIAQSTLKRIANIERHKVKDGDSILSIAKAAGLDWKLLARFNWGTDVPDQINQRLPDDVGVTTRTPDGKNWKFTSADHPGIVYVPSRWELNSLPTGAEHVIKVRLVAPLFIRLRTQEGAHRIPKADYTATWANGQEHEGTVGPAGVDLVEDPPPGDFQIQWKDQPRILASALAAHARHALDAKEQRTLLEVLKFDPDTTKLMIAAYDAHFNTHSGRGLIEDLYAAFPGEEERHMLEFALLRMDQPARSGTALATTNDQPHPDDIDDQFGKLGAVEGPTALPDLPIADEPAPAEPPSDSQADAQPAEATP